MFRSIFTKQSKIECYHCNNQIPLVANRHICPLCHSIQEETLVNKTIKRHDCNGVEYQEHLPNQELLHKYGKQNLDLFTRNSIAMRILYGMSLVLLLIGVLFNSWSFAETVIFEKDFWFAISSGLIVAIEWLFIFYLYKEGKHVVLGYFDKSHDYIPLRYFSNENYFCCAQIPADSNYLEKEPNVKFIEIPIGDIYKVSIREVDRIPYYFIYYTKEGKRKRLVMPYVFTKDVIQTMLHINAIEHIS